MLEWVLTAHTCIAVLQEVDALNHAPIRMRKWTFITVRWTVYINTPSLNIYVDSKILAVCTTRVEQIAASLLRQQNVHRVPVVDRCKLNSIHVHVTVKIMVCSAV